MRRREFARTIGAGIATLGISSSVTARSEGELPNGNVPVETVSIFSSEEDPRIVSAGSWLNHRWGWVDAEGGDSTYEDVKNWRDATEHTILIDGEEIETPEQYWGDIYQNDDGSWIVLWEYYTPPKEPGVYTFTVKTRYTEDFEDTDTDPDTRDADREAGETEFALTGYYRVVGGKRG